MNTSTPVGFEEIVILLLQDKNVKYKKVNDTIEILKNIQVNAVSLVVKENK